MPSQMELIKELRESTSAGVMDCKRALTESGNDLEKAKALLREWGVASAGKKAGRETNQGTIASYIHHNGGVGRVGALLELNCETDFVARTDEFKQLAHRIAQHIVAAGPEYVSAEELPADMSEEGRTAALRERVLLTQRFQGGNQTVEDMVKEAIGKLGENIRIGRFSRFVLGGE